MELNQWLSEGLTGGYFVQRAWSEIDCAAVKGIFIQVRSRLLSFVLDLQGNLGDATTDQELKAKASTFDASGLFKNSVFSGQTTIIVGTNNTQHVVNNVTKGDFQALTNELISLGLKQVDIDDLKQALDADAQAPQMQEKKLGPAINAWIGRMFSKAANASWQIELNIAAGVLTTKLQQFYGWLS